MLIPPPGLLPCPNALDSIRTATAYALFCVKPRFFPDKSASNLQGALLWASEEFSGNFQGNVMHRFLGLILFRFWRGCKHRGQENAESGSVSEESVIERKREWEIGRRKV